MDNIIGFERFVNILELKAFSKSLFEMNTALQLENERLKEQVKHLESLLKNSDIPTIGLGYISKELK
jgi:regulator of replication initiation timing